MSNLLAKHSEFVTNVAIMMSGKTLAALIALLTMPIVARLFEPSDFGVAAMFISITSIVSSVASLRYGTAVVLPDDHREAVALMGFAYRVLFCVCTGMLLFISAYQASGAAWRPLELLGDWIWFLPFGVLLMNALIIQENWLTRIKSFKLSSASLVVGNATTTGTRIAIGALFGSSVYGLIVGNFFGLASRFAVQQSLSKEGFLAAFRHIGWPTMRSIARRYSDFPKFNAPAGLLLSTSQNLPVLLFGVMFAPAAAGFYAMANRLSRVPVIIVAESMRRAFFQKAAAINQRGESLRRAFLLSTGGLAILGAVPSACLWWFGQPLLAWILGDRWFEAGRYVEIMAPWLFAMWVASPCHPVLIVLRKQRLWLWLQTISFLLSLGAFGLANMISAGPVWTLQAFVAISVVGKMITVLIAFALISRSTVYQVSDRESPSRGHEGDPYFP